MTATVWWGRVFGDGRFGGNHTCVVDRLTDPAGYPEVAQRLAVPDTAFVTGRKGRRVRVRTFSPVQELSGCFQTSLATAVALGCTEEWWTVEHEGGDSLEVYVDGPCEHREGAAMAWAHSSQGAPSCEPVAVPAAVTEVVGARTGVRIGHTRRRLHVRMDNLADLETLSIDAATVLQTCHEADVAGLVLHAVDGHALRVRVFTASLAGHEDDATGGAVAGVGQLLWQEGRRGDLYVRQGSTPTPSGHLRLRLGERASDIAVGGAVMPLVLGRLL